MKSLNPPPRTRINHKHLLIIFVSFGLWLRLLWPLSLSPFYSDQDWFYRSAVTSLLTGKLPILGITTSITWLHQGVVWTYLLIPALAVSDFNPISGIILTLILSLSVTPFLYHVVGSFFHPRMGLIAAFIYSFSYFSVVHSRIAYHTSPIPLFTLLIFYLILKRKWFLSGLFLGFLYQLHLLTLIFWLPVIYVITRRSGKLVNFFIGFFFGIIPFLVAGPIQTFGILFWFLKFITGASQTSGISVSYQLVFLIPVITVTAYLISRLPKHIQLPVCLVYLAVNLSVLFVSGYLTIYRDYRPTLSEQIKTIQKCPQEKPTYLYWWLQKYRNLRCYN